MQFCTPECCCDLVTMKTITFLKRSVYRIDVKKKPLSAKKSNCYSWRFSRYSGPIQWLVHGHMAFNNETGSRQMPWTGNISKTVSSNWKQFTVTREMLTAVARDRRWPDVAAGISARFSKVAFVLFCYITNHFKTGPLGNSEFCCPWISMFPLNSSLETKFTVPVRNSH